MKNIVSILAVLVFFLVSTSAFAGEGPMKLPDGAKAEAKKHNKEGIDHWNQIIPGDIDDMTWLMDGTLYAFD
mgnify:CR=1 FL=1